MPIIDDNDPEPLVRSIVLTLLALVIAVSLVKYCGPRVSAAENVYPISMGILSANAHELDAGGVGYFAIGVSEKAGHGDHDAGEFGAVAGVAGAARPEGADRGACR